MYPIATDRPPRLRLYLVECFAATRVAALEIDRRAGLLHAGDHAFRDVAYVTGFVLPVDEQVLLIVQGPDMPAVHAASHRAGLVVDRVSELTIAEGSPARILPPRPRRGRRTAGSRC